MFSSENGAWSFISFARSAEPNFRKQILLISAYLFLTWLNLMYELTIRVSTNRKFTQNLLVKKLLITQKFEAYSYLNTEIICNIHSVPTSEKKTSSESIFTGLRCKTCCLRETGSTALFFRNEDEDVNREVTADLRYFLSFYSWVKQPFVYQELGRQTFQVNDLDQCRWCWGRVLLPR